MTVQKPVLRVEGISKTYGDKQVLKGVSLSINEGELKILIGPSGGGQEHASAVYQFSGDPGGRPCVAR